MPPQHKKSKGLTSSEALRKPFMKTKSPTKIKKVKAWALIENGNLLRWEQGGKLQPDIFFSKKDAEQARREWDGRPDNLIRIRVITIIYPLI